VSAPNPVRDRAAAVYARYAASKGKRRAWDPRNPGNAAIRDELAAAILATLGDDLGRGDVLDAGCGSGWWLARLHAAGVPGARLFGVELLPQRARAAAAAVPGATVQTGDVRSLPFADGRFSAAFMLTVLSSMEPGESAAAIAEVRRVLAPGAPLVVWEPRVPNPLNPNTRLVRARELGPARQTRTLTLLPWVARRLGRRTAGLYPRLAAVRALRTHRLYVVHR
jgi:SAM-dependent methyltransferase